MNNDWAYFILSKFLWKDLIVWVLIYLFLLILGGIRYAISYYNCWSGMKDQTFIGWIITIWEHVLIILPCLLFIDAIHFLLVISEMLFK